MRKASRGWIKRPQPRVVVRGASPACICLTDFEEVVAEEWRLLSEAPGAEPPPVTCPSPDVRTRSQVAFLHFPPQIISWLMCTLITFQEDSGYMEQVATNLDSTDIEHSSHCKKFYWTDLG